MVGDEPDGPIIISCYKLTEEELEEINRTKRVWLTVISHRMPPVALTGMKPFNSVENRED
jgi:hypothetical protein